MAAPDRRVQNGPQLGIPDKDIQYMSHSRVPGHSQDEEVDVTQHVHQLPYGNYDQTTIILFNNNDLNDAKIIVSTPGSTPPPGVGQILDAQYGVPPQIINGRLMMPLRSISDQTGASLSWNGNTRQVTMVAPVVSDAN